MQAGRGGDGANTEEVRVRVEGGLAHFPGRARDQVVSFDRLAVPERDEIAHLADAARFFDCSAQPADRPGATRPDARTYTVALTIAGRSREICVAEPIGDPALARLVSALRRLVRRHDAG